MKSIIALAFLTVASANPKNLFTPPSLPKIEGMDMINIQMPDIYMPVVDFSQNEAVIKQEKMSMLETPAEVENNKNVENVPVFKKMRIFEPAMESVKVAEAPAKTGRFVERADGALMFEPAMENNYDESPNKVGGFVELANGAFRFDLGAIDVEEPEFAEAPSKMGRFVESADGVLQFHLGILDAEEIQVAEPTNKMGRFIESADGILTFAAVPIEAEEAVKVAESPAKFGRFVESADGILSFAAVPVAAQEAVKIAEAPVKLGRFVESADGSLSYIQDAVDTQDTVKIADSPALGRSQKEAIKVVESPKGVISFVSVYEDVAPVPIHTRY